jgi:hypothetical protein
VELTVSWCFVLSTCELIIFLYPTGKERKKEKRMKEKERKRKCKNHAENIRSHHTKFSCMSNLAPGICAPKNIYVHCPCFVVYSFDEYTVIHTAGQECSTFTYLYLLGSRVGAR